MACQRLKRLPALLVCGLTPVFAAASEELTAHYRSRHRAAVIALFADDHLLAGAPAAHAEGDMPQLWQFAACLLARGGFSVPAVAGHFHLPRCGAAQAGKLLRQLDILSGREPPHGNRNASLPDALLAAAVAALVYAQAETDGLAAAEMCGALFSDQTAAPFCCRAIFKALALCLSGANNQRDILFMAADAAGDETVGRELRAVRALPLERLADESSYTGRLQRIFWIWLRAEDYEAAWQQGNGMLRDKNALRLLAALLAAHLGMAGLPENLRSHGGRSAELLSLEIELFDLATRGLLLPVNAATAPAAGHIAIPSPSRTSSAESGRAAP